MIFIFPEPACNLNQSPLQSTHEYFGCFLGFRAEPIFSKKVFTESFELPFTPKKLNERKAQAVDIQFLLLLLVLTADYSVSQSEGHQFSARTTGQENADQRFSGAEPRQQYRQHTSKGQFKDRSQNQQQHHRSEYQKTSGSQRNEYQETPDVGRPNMAKVNEALNGLGLEGSNLHKITEQEVNKAFKKKALVHHPDKVAKEKAKESEQIFQGLVSYRDLLFDFINSRNNRR